MRTKYNMRLVAAPNGEFITPTNLARIMAFKTIIEKANEERLQRSEVASRLILGGTQVSELTAYRYIRLLGIKWHHARDYRKPIPRLALDRKVPPLLAQGHTMRTIAKRVGCSPATISRYCREAALVGDEERYCGALDPKLNRKPVIASVK